tara:strand:- start:173 stop:709 length:537 start_codon:yes stop_codon:yes gene_type:complete
MKKVFLSIISIILLSSCERITSISNNINDESNVISDEARTFDVGVCFIDYNAIDLSPGDTFSTTGVEIVNCKEAHNVEVISSYSYVPSWYLDEIDPLEEICFDDTIDYVDKLHPYKNSEEMNDIYGEFDTNFAYLFYYTTAILSPDTADLNEEFQCSIRSRNGFKRGKFEKIIRNFGK